MVGIQWDLGAVQFAGDCDASQWTLLHNILCNFFAHVRQPFDQ
jgi:hypothetical protein